MLSTLFRQKIAIVFKVTCMLQNEYLVSHVQYQVSLSFKNALL